MDQLFCSHCWNDLEPGRDRCPGCDAELHGSGQFSVLHGARPSELFRKLIATSTSFWLIWKADHLAALALGIVSGFELVPL